MANEEFRVAMVAWKVTLAEAEASGDPKPGVTEYIGKCFLDIATHLSYRPNFIGYSYREEMISDGIENCLMYCSNFDPKKSSNPFSGRWATPATKARPSGLLAWTRESSPVSGAGSPEVTNIVSP